MVDVDYKMSDDDFMNRPIAEQNLIMFKMLANSQITDKILADKMEVQRCECYEKFRKLERRKWFDKGVAAFSGGLTGILTALGIKIGG